jgi:PD-(D/E)XK nuclease family transposase
MTLLKRTNDLVFKKLFVMSKSGLKGMLSAVLGEEVRDISVLNPEIPGDFVGEGGDKIIVLDVRVELLDGQRVIVEMQMLVSDVELPPRLVFYAA